MEVIADGSGLQNPVTGLHDFLTRDFDDRQDSLAELVAHCCGHSPRAAPCHDTLEQAVRELYRDLQPHPRFQAAVQAAAVCRPWRFQPWRYHLLIDTPQLKVGLVTVFRFARIPLHDHPDAHGAQLLLSGKLHLRQYDPVPVEENRARLVNLERVVDQRLSVGDVSTFTPCARNLHELESLTARCVALSVVIDPFDEPKRSWYFPVNALHSLSQGLYTRVSSRKRDLRKDIETRIGSPLEE